MKTDSSGDTLWTHIYSISPWNEGHSVEQTSDGGYIIGGFESGYDNGIYEDYNVYLIKTNEMGLVTSVENKYYSEVPNWFALYSNYPNPFNSTTSIRYDLQQFSKVSLIIYDLLGQEIIQLVNKYENPGSYVVHWDGKDSSGKELSSGLYLYRLETNYLKLTKRMILLK